MFTGLIETVGSIVSRSVKGGAGKLKVKPVKRFSGLRKGESIAVNGACLTLEDEGTDGSLVFHTLSETLKRCNLGSLKIGSKVNLERAMALGDRLDGHLVQGHVDCNAKLLSLGKSGEDIELALEVPASLSPFMVEKGSVAIDGVSLTIVSLSATRFTVHLIPTTWEATALRFRRKGDSLNLEGDLIGKYVFRQLSFASAPAKAAITMEDLNKAGF